MGSEFGGIELDAHREPLHDLDPVARRVLGRDRCKRRARTARNTSDATPVDHLRPLAVGGHPPGLAGSNRSEERRVGKGRVRTVRSRWLPSQETTQQSNKTYKTHITTHL